MFSNRFKAAASPTIFLMSSLGLTFTGPNTLVVAGGICLILAAIICLLASLIPGFGAKYGRIIPVLSLSSNVPLTISGVLMVQGGTASGQPELAIAGACIAVANFVFYGSANLRGCFNRITASAHAYCSMVAGSLIAAAGAALLNPVLAVIGLGYVTEAALRRNPAPAPGSATQVAETEMAA